MRGEAVGTFVLALLLIVPVLPAGPTAASSQAELGGHLQDALQDPPARLRVIVDTHGPPEPAAETADDLGADVVWTYQSFDAFAADIPSQAIYELAADEHVERIELDLPVAPTLDVSRRAIEADKAEEAGFDASQVSVAVLDTGIDLTHPFFQDAISACVSLVGGVQSPECQDSDGHGSHVSGIVASRDGQFTGVATRSKIAAVRVLNAAGSGLSSDALAGFDWVIQNKDNVDPPIRVINLSLGPLDPGCDDGSNSFAQKVDQAVDAGLVVTVAAGNSGHDQCTIDAYAASQKAITVAAVDDQNTVGQDDDVIAGFSSGGSDINDKPDIAYPGVDIWSAFTGTIFISEMSGTSQAAPHAAATAALMLDQDPTLTPADVKDQIIQNAVQTDNTGDTFDFVYGHGLGNACRALLLDTCFGTPEPGTVHVADVDTAWTHKGGEGKWHLVKTEATIVDVNGTPVKGASVSFNVTAPDGTLHQGGDKTDEFGVASFTAKTKKDEDVAHGTWEGCVADVDAKTLTYDPGSNEETCETVEVG